MWLAHALSESAHADPIRLTAHTSPTTEKGKYLTSAANDTQSSHVVTAQALSERNLRNQYVST